MAYIAIMQSRLGPPENGISQLFPSSRWRDEFEAASTAGINGIEWIYDFHGVQVNPLVNTKFTLQMLELSRRFGVEVHSVCTNYYMEFPICRQSLKDRKNLATNFDELIGRCHVVGISRIVLPLLETSSLATPNDVELMTEFIRLRLPVAEANSVEIHIETDLAPEEFAILLSQLDHPLIWATYDTGNSASLGYDSDEELEAYGRRIGSVHIKDRILGGSTVPLGTGDTDFARIFRGLAELGYRGEYVLEVARSTSGDEIASAHCNRNFVEQLLMKAGLQ